MGIIDLSRDNLVKLNVKMLRVILRVKLHVECDCYNSIYLHTVYKCHVAMWL
jgi:hypothetical protein